MTKPIVGYWLVAAMAGACSSPAVTLDGPAVGGSAVGGGAAMMGGAAASTGGAAPSTGGAATSTGGESARDGEAPDAGLDSAAENDAQPGTDAVGPETGAAQPPVIDFSCATDDDCCVVLDACMATQYLVTRRQYGEMEDYVATLKPPSVPPFDHCLACIPPGVQVSCSAGRCAGQYVWSSSASTAGLRQSHCGSLPLDDAAVPETYSAPPDDTVPTDAAPPDAGPLKTKFSCSGS